MAKTPPYIQLANELRRDILQGKYGTEGGLPGIEHLIKTSGLARGTVYRSLTLLQGEGLIKERDRAFYVNQSSITITQHVPPPHIRLQAVGKIAFMRNLEPVAPITVPDYIAKLLELTEEVTVTFRYRVSGELVDGREVPARLLKYHYLIPLTDEQIQQMQDDPHTDILLELYPVQMVRHDDISARLPTKEEAQHLDIPETTPVLGVRIVNRDMEGNALLVQELALVNTTLSYEYLFENKPKQ